jgi:hypothetical protein
MAAGDEPLLEVELALVGRDLRSQHVVGRRQDARRDTESAR